MWCYYRDVTLYGLMGCMLPALSTYGLYDSWNAWLLQCIIMFGLFGTALGILGYSYFQKQQYYVYYNLGFTRKRLWLISWRTNLIISVLFLLIVRFFGS
ncbi:MAG: hypothetical protein ABNH00_06560 [Dokdonia sp.]|jgi:hypothetical protein|nr:hypothetical protein [Cytophagaceae bacterium]